jgi:hypothetical protein
MQFSGRGIFSSSYECWRDGEKLFSVGFMGERSEIFDGEGQKKTSVLVDEVTWLDFEDLSL